MSDLDLDALGALEAAATEGPWAIWHDLDHQGFKTVGDAHSYEEVAGEGSTDEANPTAHVYVDDDAALIVALRNAAPALIAAAREAEMMRPNYEGVPCDGGCSYGDGPQEECSLHGRSPADLWRMLAAAVAERDAATALLNGHRCDEKAERAYVRAVRAEAERDAAQAALARVKALHVETHPGEYGSACRACAVTWPCATIRALGGETQEAGS